MGVTYVTFQLPVAKSVPSSSASPVMNGTSATCPASTSCCGGAVRNVPSARGGQGVARPE